MHIEQDIWAFQEQLTKRLAAWAILSMLAGGLTVPAGGLWQALGTQCLAWGAINLGIAFLGRRNMRRRAAQPGWDEGGLRKETEKLRRILLINSGLDVLYVAGGIALVLSWGAANPTWAGHG